LSLAHLSRSRLKTELRKRKVGRPALVRVGPTQKASRAPLIRLTRAGPACVCTRPSVVVASSGRATTSCLAVIVRADGGTTWVVSGRGVRYVTKGCIRALIRVSLCRVKYPDAGSLKSPLRPAGTDGASERQAAGIASVTGLT